MDKVKLLGDFALIFKSNISKLVLPTCKADPLNCTIDDYLKPRPYIGYFFESKISELKPETSLSQAEEHNLSQECQYFLISLYKQLKQRLPDDSAILKNRSLFSVNNVL